MITHVPRRSPKRATARGESGRDSGAASEPGLSDKRVTTGSGSLSRIARGLQPRSRCWFTPEARHVGTFAGRSLTVADRPSGQRSASPPSPAAIHAGDADAGPPGEGGYRGRVRGCRNQHGPVRLGSVGNHASRSWRTVVVSACRDARTPRPTQNGPPADGRCRRAGPTSP